MMNERIQTVWKRVVRQWCRAGKHATIAVLMTVWAVGRGIRATLHFAAMPFEIPIRRERSDLAKLTRRTTGFAVDAAYVIVPVLALFCQWTL